MGRGVGSAVVAAVLAAAVLAACSGKTEEPARPQVVTWEKVDVGAEPVALAEHDGRILVGVKHAGAKVVPGLVVLDGAERKTVTVRPSAASPYSYLAIWYSLAWDGKRVLGLGGATGGAHGNVRWTVWTGSVDGGLQEHPQTFDTFNGLSAGQMTSAVLTPSGQALTGSWEGVVTGLDAAVWLPQANNRWLRQESAKTPLQNTKNLLVGANYATAYGDGLVLTGSQVRLEPNVVAQGAALWRSEKLAQGWTRVELPEPGSRSQANTATCGQNGCVVSGFVENKLAIWRYDDTGARRLSGVPELAVADKDVLPPPLSDGSADGDITQVIAQDNKIKILDGRPGNWTVLDSNGPQGPATALVRTPDQEAYLIAGGALWKTKLPS